MKKIVFLASVLISALTWAESTVTGTVLTDSKTPVANAVVSDGFSVVKTGENGSYSMPFNPMSKFVFISVPSGYDIPVDDTNSPLIWQVIDRKAESHVHNFTLKKQVDGGKADSSHVLVVIGDPQVFDSYGIWRFRNETVEDLKQLQQSYPAGTKFIGMIVGDLVWDKYEYFSYQKTSLEMFGFPTFVAIGNHDHNRSASKQTTQHRQDSVASLKFEAVFGPTYYSFNVGPIHYVVLDNVYYRGYQGGDKGYDCVLTDKQKAWVEKDIAQLSPGTQVVFSAHIIASNMKGVLDTLQMLTAPLQTTNYFMSGHSHTSSTVYWADNFIEHNVAACQGSYWSCDWCADGTPNGYKVFETNQQGICNWYYKGTGLDKDFRICTAPKGSINAGNSKLTSVLANIWDYNEKCTVKVLVNGVEKAMKQFEGTDPTTYDLMLDEGDTRPNYPGSEGGTEADRNPGSKKSEHMFYYTPKSAEKNASFEVVFTDPFGKVTKVPVLNHMMVASFNKVDNQWIYQQDFNTLPSYPNYMNASTREARGTWVSGHTPLGWYGCAQDTIVHNYLRINNGSQNVGWLYSYGEGNPARTDQNSRERALGSFTDNTQQHIRFGVILENNTGSAITGLDISYMGEVWRMGSNTKAKEKLQFSYALLTDAEAKDIRDRTHWIGEIETTAADLLSFTTPSTVSSSATCTEINGNNANNSDLVEGSIELTWAPGTVLLLRWDDDRTTETEDQALAIDDLTIVAHTSSTDLPEQMSLLKMTQPNHAYFYNGQVLIDCNQRTYNLSGQQIR